MVIPPGVRRGANRRRAGEDMRRGQVVLQPGLRLRPQDVGVAASARAAARLEVFRPLRVALLSTGDELCEPGAALADGRAPTTPTARSCCGLLQGLGCRVNDLGILPDRAEAVAAGAARGGRRARCGADLGRRLARRRGPRGARGRAPGPAAFLADRGQARPAARVRPARPSCVFIGLPGNPVAAVICFLRFARPVLVALGGGRWPEPHGFPVPADFAMGKKPGRREYLRARLVGGAGRAAWAQRIAREGSGILTSLTEADGLVELAEDVTRGRARRARSRSCRSASSAWSAECARAAAVERRITSFLMPHARSGLRHVARSACGLGERMPGERGAGTCGERHDRPTVLAGWPSPLRFLLASARPAAAAGARAPARRRAADPALPVGGALPGRPRLGPRRSTPRPLFSLLDDAVAAYRRPALPRLPRPQVELQGDRPAGRPRRQGLSGAGRRQGRPGRPVPAQLPLLRDLLLRRAQGGRHRGQLQSALRRARDRAPDRGFRGPRSWSP